MVKNIIFDFGGVLYNLDFNKTFAGFKAFGFSDFEQKFSQYNADSLFQNLETGKIASQEFYDSIKKMTSYNITNHQIKAAWNALLIGYRLPSLEYLTELQKKYNLFLLSNTNKIHYDYFSQQLKSETPYQSLESFFTKAYFSHQIGLRKPGVEVFEFVLADAKINANETLFIDDTQSNFTNAIPLGIKTHLLNAGELIENIAYGNF